MKTLLSVSIPALTLFVAGAWNTQPSQELCSTSRTDVPPPALSVTAGHKPQKMWTNNSTIYKGETLELQFTAPNAPYLGVIDPQGHFFYVVFPREAAIGKLKPFVDSKRFYSLQSVKIQTAAFKADPYTHGVYTNQPVFTQSGVYTFILGENLHIDDPEFVDKLTVKYVHGRRPAKGTTDVASL